MAAKSCVSMPRRLCKLKLLQARAHMHCNIAFHLSFRSCRCFLFTGLCIIIAKNTSGQQALVTTLKALASTAPSTWRVDAAEGGPPAVRHACCMSLLTASP